MQTSGNLSLYFHIPFCKKKCPYCHFYVIPNQDHYHKMLLDGLDEEWQQRLSLIKEHTIKTIYFGGGTPSLLSPEAVQKLLGMIAKTQPIENLEITMEANPEDPKLFHQFGINRLSFGVQSFDSNHLKLLAREHSAEQAINAIHQAYDSGIENISIDLMYDLPHQTLETWEHSLKIASELPITHLSLYNLTIEPHTMFFKQQEKLTLHMPSPDLSRRMYEMAQEILTQAGFEQYEISAFSKPGFASQHNSGYWTARPFLGFGPSAYSYYSGKRFRNAANLNRYTQALSLGQSAVDFEEELSQQDQIKERLAIHLRLLKGVNLSTFPKLPEETAATIQFLLSKGLLILKDQMLSLSPRGILLYDSVATELI